MKNSRRARIVNLLKEGMAEVEILAVLEKEFPPSKFSTSNKQALEGTKRDLGNSGPKEVRERTKPSPKPILQPNSLKHKELRMKYDYKKYFKKWKNWDEFEQRFDGINGVYAFRLKSAFGRLNGVSQVLYIGSCDQSPEGNSRAGLWHRLKNYRQNNDGASRRLKEVEATFSGRSGIEYSYRPCESPREVEEALLADYNEKHLELPPLNRNKSKGNS